MITSDPAATDLIVVDDTISPLARPFNDAVQWTDQVPIDWTERPESMAYQLTGSCLLVHLFGRFVRHKN